MSQVEQVTRRFQSFIGAQEGFSNNEWNNDIRNIYGVNFSEIYGEPDRVAWCDIGFWVCFRLEGLDSLIPKSESCYDSLSTYQSWSRSSEFPAVGAQFFVSSAEYPRGGAHTGFVVGYDSSSIQTVEFNTNITGGSEGDGCYAKTRSRFGNESSGVYAYGYPKYAEGIVSADPAWGGTAAGAGSPAAGGGGNGLQPFPGTEFFHVGQHSDIITRMGQRLVSVGCSRYQVGPGPDWGPADQNSYAAFQRSLGFSGGDADGMPGPSSWTRLQVPA
ncbi:peptidoglycan-binding protein [Kitasatospora sp. NPDC049285]|uniref:peptidoglycan-binding protein n=1 Tax=Kitasatospora sp. NPDC049285 TaxID=3157096 RepID=UPI00343B06F0